MVFKSNAQMHVLSKSLVKYMYINALKPKNSHKPHYQDSYSRHIIPLHYKRAVSNKTRNVI